MLLFIWWNELFAWKLLPICKLGNYLPRKYQNLHPPCLNENPLTYRLTLSFAIITFSYIFLLQTSHTGFFTCNSQEELKDQVGQNPCVQSKDQECCWRFKSSHFVPCWKKQFPKDRLQNWKKIRYDFILISKLLLNFTFDF